jgi:hypothetical protein
MLLHFSHCIPGLGSNDTEDTHPRVRRKPQGGKGVMTLDDLKRLGRLLTGALIVLLVHEFFAPRAAEAGCNHLVFSQSDRLVDFNRLDTLIVAASSSLPSMEQAQDPLRQQPPERRVPCSGASCSSRVPFPVSTASRGFKGFDQWGALSALVRKQFVSPAEKTIAKPALRSTVYKLSIFHPPPA